MVKPAKLYAQLLQSRSRIIDFRDFVGMIEAFGFRQIRQSGSHRSFAHPQSDALLVIQPKGKEAKRYQVRQFLAIVEEDGLTMDE